MAFGAVVQHLDKTLGIQRVLCMIWVLFLFICIISPPNAGGNCVMGDILVFVMVSNCLQPIRTQG